MDSINVLSLDGGGMRGLYTAALLETLAQRVGQNRGGGALDVGTGFDLIAGTSTGAILACGLAQGLDISRIKALYQERGPDIFPDPMPSFSARFRLRERLRFYRWCWRHRFKPGSNGRTLRSALREIFGDETLGGVFGRRSIGLCLSATALHNQHPRVFKTGHLGDEFRRDDQVRLVDACLASAAAPVYLPLASLNGDVDGAPAVYADGGLWVNNPVTLGITEALAMAEPEQPIRVLSIGTSQPASGGDPAKLQRGLADWKVGAGALELSMNAQARAAHHQATKLVEQLVRRGVDIKLFRCVESPPPSGMAEIIGLDRADSAATEALIRHGMEDGTSAFAELQRGSEPGRLIAEIFERMTPISRGGNKPQPTDQ